MSKQVYSQSRGTIYLLRMVTDIGKKPGITGQESGSCLSRAADMINTNLLPGIHQDNCGPVDTRMPLPGSPVMDAGADSSAPDYDAIGTARSQGVASDNGAIEVFQ